jgi:hypothetical protein
MAKMTIDQRREKVFAWWRQRKWYQFGQPDSWKVSDSACSDTSIQHVVKLTKDLNVSLNAVRDRSGAPNSTPMNSDEALRALRSYGLPYVRVNDLRAAELMRVARARGPVILCVAYWAYPQWLGYTYAGRTLWGTSTSPSGRRVNVGVSIPKRHSGLTQWTFRLGHAVVLGTDTHQSGKHLGVIRDHNHNSASRPERPAYDLLTAQQINRMLDAYRDMYGYRVALIPTRPVITK